MKRLILLGITSLALLAACGGSENEVALDLPVTVHTVRIDGQGLGRPISLVEVNVNGVSCIVAQSQSGTGISCDWPQR